MIAQPVSITQTKSDRIQRAAQPRTLRYAHITGWGMDLPSHIMSNDDFKPLVNVGHDWIFPRTGISERRIARDGQTTTDLAIQAAQRALQVAGKLPSEIDLIVVATSTPEFIFPSTASIVQDRLGAIHAGAYDLAAACSGFVYALDMVVDKIRTGSIRAALVIGAETMSRVLDWKDRKTCVLFGDGAGALVLEGSDRPGGVLHSLLRSDGSGWDLLTLPTVNSQQTYLRSHNGTPPREIHRIYMDGRCVFQFATGALADSVRAVLEEAGLTPDDLDLLIPHQANQRILDVAAQSLGLPPEKIYVNLDRFGNTSAASIPIALTEALRTNRIKPGDLVALAGFGGGLSWGAALIAWDGASPHNENKHSLATGRRQLEYGRAAVRRFWLRYYWRRMVKNSPSAWLRRWRRKLSTHRPDSQPSPTSS